MNLIQSIKYKESIFGNICPCANAFVHARSLVVYLDLMNVKILVR